MPEFFFEKPIDEFVIASEVDEEIMQSVAEMLGKVIKKESGFKFHAKEALKSGSSNFPSCGKMAQRFQNSLEEVGL